MKKYVSKILSPSDVASKLAVPSGWVGLGRLLPMPVAGSEAEGVPILTKDELGNHRSFMLKVRSPRRGNNYPKPEFRRREWRAFVAEKGLRAGDAVYFWWDTRGFFRVQARRPPRPYRLFGTSFFY